jgi:hypothetical protein
MVKSYLNAKGQGWGGKLPKLSIPSPSSREREADPSPALQESDPKVPETSFNPFFLRGCSFVGKVGLDLWLAPKGLMSLFICLGLGSLNVAGNSACLLV